jgi:hypothetical protein
MGLRVLIFVVNQLARLGEAAIMRFPLDTADD